MSQLSLSLDTPLMVRDGRGRYRPADADQILE
ncbi:DNA repair protein RadC, partial [Pseudomonas aeruginosa]